MTELFTRWGAFGTSTSILASTARFLIYCTLLFLAFQCISVKFEWPEQAALAVLTILVAYIVHSVSQSNLVTLALMFASMLSTGRYAYWRISEVFKALNEHGLALGIINIFFMLLLLSAEAYAFFILYLGYIQTIQPLRRPPAPMPDNVEDWPHVDLFIPTYNEPLSIVRSTIFAALNIDYPADKLHAYVLDDGRREDFRKFCEKAGIGYITRSDNAHAKAGNINHALTQVDSPYVVIFDCDHIPTRSFLQMSLGWFLKDPKMGIIQTPHYFYSPDPFERNLNQFMSIPNEGELFYGVIQDGNDLWNATFFCGSCAAIRRSALDEIGGIAVETVTEDAHTSLRIQMRGWNTGYINFPQAAGLATESLSGHIGQRIRWARGMVQIIRTDNPLFAKGLRWPQRLCYFNAMVHFFYAMPRLIFLTAPLVYMLLSCLNIPGFWGAILVYSAPHLFLSNVTNLRIQGRYRYSFWNEVYETVLAPYILGPTILALINPKLGKFNVTAKGGLITKGYFDARIARPYIVLILLNVLGLIVAPIRFFYWNPDQPGTIAMNAFWILFNLVILGTANAVAYESRQRREEVRINVQRSAEIRLPDGTSVFGESTDMSLGGAMLQLEEALTLPEGSDIHVTYALRGKQLALPATVVGINGKTLRLQYKPLSLEEEENLTLALYSSADSWLTRNERRVPDRPLHSFGRLVRLSVKGVGYALFGWIPKKKSPPLKTASAGAAVIIAILLALPALYAQKPKQTSVSAKAPNASSEGSFNTSFALHDIGIPEEITFHGVAASRKIPFSLPQNELVQQASLNLHYAFSPGLIPQLSHLGVILNGTLIATLPVPENNGRLQNALTTPIPLPEGLLVRDNVLEFQFIGHYTQQCEDPANTVLWARVENTSTIQLSGSLLPLADDLKILPLPFYDGAVSSESATIPFVFPAPPTGPALTAAGVVASWFGALAKSRPLYFPVSIESLPKGNIVLFADNASSIPPGFNMDVRGPAVAVRTNPNDPYGKVLVIAGDTPEHLLDAARSLVIGNALLQGSTAQINNLQLPEPRAADDAPLWIKTDRIVPFSDYPGLTELQSDGSGPLPVYMRVPPDLYYGDRKNLKLHIDYWYNAISLANASTLRVDANSAVVNQLPLPHADDPRKNLSYDIPLPVIDMRPFANTLLFNFYFQIAKMGNCQDSAPINLQGAVVKSSYLDIKGLHHWASLPNLELFANAGFPFTRFADFAQTKIVLPPTPTPEETALYLTLMAYFGEQTGYPAIRLQTGDASLLGQDADYLILGTPQDQPAFDRLKDALPVAVKDRSISVRDTGNFFDTAKHAWWQIAQLKPNWWQGIQQVKQRRGLVESLGEIPDALIQGIESPWSKNRSVVTISYKENSATTQFASAFWKTSMSGDISQSISVLHGNTFSSYRLGDSYYFVGHLPFWAKIRYWLHEYPWLIVLLTFVLGLVIVPWIKFRLDHQAKKRLEPTA